MYIFLMIATVVLPIILWVGLRSLFDKRHNKITTAVSDAYARVVIRNLLSISEVNLMGDRLIAIDKSHRKLVLVVHKNGITWEKCVDLNRIVFCQVVKGYDRESGCIETVDLELTIGDSYGSIHFPFFDHRRDTERDLPSRLKKAQFWKKKIQLQLSTFQLNYTG